jgi:hypothetical protein
MSRAANVLSVQALKDFKNAMITFSEEARNSLSGVDMELRRMRDWMERDQLGYWQMQVKRRSEEVMQARSDLHRRKISQQGSDAVSDTEQKEALRDATRRLRVAEEKVALIKRLIPQLHHAIAEYHSHSQPLGDHLTGGFERSLNSLERMVLSLEAYLATNAPTLPRHESAAASSGASAATATAGTGGGDSGSAEADAGSGADAGNAPPAAPAVSPGVGNGNATATHPAGGESAPTGEAVISGRT